MCMSNVYKRTESGPQLFCKNIESVKVDAETGTILFTDIIGNEYQIHGSIESINLSANIIHVLERAES